MTGTQQAEVVELRSSTDERNLVFDKFDAVKKTRNGYIAKCPAHKDENPSLSISAGKDGRILLHCHAGCTYESILAALDLKPSDLSARNGKSARRIEAIYSYTDENGTLLYQVVRDQNKKFLQRRPDGNGGWIYNLKGVRRVLYRLPEIVDKKTIWIVEGEKDADRLWSSGLPATCNPGGAGKWQDEYSQALVGKQLVILLDNDPPGEQHAQQVARSVLPCADAVKLVRLPGLPDKGDVSDWLDAGHTRDELIALARATPVLKRVDVKSEQPASGTLTLTRISDVKTQPIKWLWRGRIPLGKVTVFDGDPGLGKSLLSADLAARVSCNRPMPDGSKSDLAGPAGVVLLSAEDDPSDTIRPRLEVVGADLERIVLLQGVKENDEERMPSLADIALLKQAIATADAKLVVIDPLMAYLLGDVNSYKDQDIRRALAPLAALAAELNVAIVVIRHLNKSSSSNPLYRGGGSIGIIGAARSGLLVAKDPEDEDRRILAITK